MVVVRVFFDFNTPTEFLDPVGVGLLQGNGHDCAAVAGVHAHEDGCERLAGAGGTVRDDRRPRVEVGRFGLHDRALQLEEAGNGVVEMVHRLDVPRSFDDLDAQRREVIGELELVGISDLKAG